MNMIVIFILIRLDLACNFTCKNSLAVPVHATIHTCCYTFLSAGKRACCSPDTKSAVSVKSWRIPGRGTFRIKTKSNVADVPARDKSFDSLIHAAAAYYQ
ncbi:hypothetical protein K461DRAFT_60523 [Myriangium duriaei CBS 260.36]|uniref:Secreted protein n=1 Tax=Myriangium duriaei CBS 260.36 TaxID=1168546 RepID=A0A9P4IWT1_9PEZI|nr:hypothetical protein K461DRAFT_60523 [Myriangium duriaei CBS 260.36]